MVPNALAVTKFRFSKFGNSTRLADKIFGGFVAIGESSVIIFEVEGFRRKTWAALLSDVRY